MFSFKALSGGIPIGGSHYLIELEGKRIAIDCGAVQRDGKTLAPPIASGHIDALFATHGHFDHIGMLPAFAKEHPQTPVYSTKVTWRFAKMLLWDSYFFNLRKLERGEKVEASFTASEIKSAVSHKRFRLIHRPEWFSPWPDWKVRFRPSGHINGAATIDIVSPGGFRIIHSGDISFHDQPTIKGAENINDMFAPDALITEATYGDRNLPDRKSEERRFINWTIRVLKRGGKVLVPSFSIAGMNIGIVLANGLAEAGIDIPVYLDGMVRTAARIVNVSNEWSPSDNGLIFPANLVAIPENQESYAFRDKIIEAGRPAVVVSSHGMLEGGFAMFYLPYILSDYKSAVLLPGYQVEGTGGRRLLELEREHYFYVNRQVVPKNCDVERFQLSSHASGKEMSDWISEIQPWQVTVVHATERGFEGLKNRIRERHPAIRVLGGYNGEKIEE